MEGYQLKITIRGSKPPVWRRINIPAELSFDDLHETIQELFGWMNYHLFEFRIPSSKIRLIDTHSWDDETAFMDMQTLDTEATLSTYLKPDTKLVYTYDMGDNWEHDILVEKCISMDEPYPVLVKWIGDNFAEDAGNTWGYNEICQIAKDTKHPEHEEMKQWLETQHIDFNEAHVKEMLEDICVEEEDELPEPYATEVFQALQELNSVLKQIKDMDMSVISMHHHQQHYVVGIKKIEDDYTIQIYDSFKDFVHGLQLASETNAFNIYANAILIILANEEMPLQDMEAMEPYGFVKRLKTGYLPLSITPEDVAGLVEVLAYLCAVLKDQETLPSYDDERLLNGTYDSDHWNVSIMEICSDIEVQYVYYHKELLASLLRQKTYPHEICIDVIGIPHENFTKNNQLRIMLIMEDEVNTFEHEIERESLISFETLNIAVLDKLKQFIMEYGIMKGIIVNNENLSIMLQGAAEDLKLPLKIEPFTTELEKEFHDERMDQDVQFLEMLANLDEEEFEQMLDSMSPQEFLQFEQFINGFEEECDEEEPTFEA